MTTSKKTVLLVTDFSYQAKGRDYFREDVELSCSLRKHFHVCISHIDDLEQVVEQADAILLRNTGPKLYHLGPLTALRKRTDLALFNDLQGKGDMDGKHHLLALFRLGYPVIPTFSSKENLPEGGKFLLKPLDGADSMGVKILSREELAKESCANLVIQPLIDFQYEVSFYFIGKEFHYALYAPDPKRRWELKPYPATEGDIDFARKFIDWNSCRFGIQRVDACRTQDGKLLLMELEDYNPFLSLDLLPKQTRERFIDALSASLTEMIEK